MQGLCALASGSKGNSYLIRSAKCNLLIDAGISAKSLIERLETVGLHPSDLDGVLVSHEHIDHIRALKTLSTRWSLPILCNIETAKGICAAFVGYSEFDFKIFTTRDPFHFYDLQITAFPVQHDALDPVAFKIESPQFSAGICTDLGFFTPLTLEYLKGVQALVLESNHTPDLVWASKRSITYKQRVLGRFGHLSNTQCAEMLKELYHPDLRHVVLAHLSEECNKPNLALEEAKKALLDVAGSAGSETQLSIAKQDAALEFMLLDLAAKT